MFSICVRRALVGKELSASTGDGKDAFYSNSGWISKPDDTDVWLQYTNDDKSYKLWGLSTWGVGAGDETGLWVTEYFLEFQSKHDENRWYPYKEGKSNEVYYFSGNIDPFSEKHHNLKDSFTFNVLRIRPKHWHTFDGDDIGSVGMRVEFYGCVADDILRKLFLEVICIYGGYLHSGHFVSERDCYIYQNFVLSQFLIG